LHRPETVYTASVFLPKDAVVIRFFFQAYPMDSAQVYLPEVSPLERIEIQSSGREQSLEVTLGQEYVPGGVAAAVGAAHTGKTKPVVIKRASPGTRSSRCSVEWSFEGKDGSLLGADATLRDRRGHARVETAGNKKPSPRERRLYGERRIRTFEG
jgi:hypothetical protein